MTRNGKIARLPRHIREQLNRRLEDGEQGKKLVAWLNSLPSVQDILEVDFHGRPINEQNLTEWKQGGYQDWLRHQESCEWVRTVTEEATELSSEAGLMPLSDRLSPMVGLALGKMIRTIAGESLTDEKKREEMLSLARELAQLRRDDLSATKLRLILEQNERDLAERERKRQKHAERQAEWAPFHELLAAVSKERTLQTFLPQGASLEVENELRALVNMPPRRPKPAKEGVNQAPSN